MHDAGREAAYSRMVCGLCLSNMVRLDDSRFHCAKCQLEWTVASTAPARETS